MDIRKKTLKLGVAYHGNRMTHHAMEDFRDIANHNMSLVVHMLSHTDWDRHLTVMKDQVSICDELGIESWMDNWGLGGPPGDKSHFLAYYPDSHMYYSNGAMDPVRACLNSPDFRKFTKQWIDAVVYTGAKTIFWDEPHIPLKYEDDKTYYACACPRCKKLFEEKYGKPMPEFADDDVNNFRVDTIVDYFSEVTEYAASKNIVNTICVMLGTHHGISLENIERICSLPYLNNVGSDPYWLGQKDVNPYEYVYNGTKANLAVSEKCGKDHNIWIQTFGNPRGREEEIVAAAEGAYDAGARTIIAWGYYGSISNDYRAANPEMTWKKTCDAMERIYNMDRDETLKINRALFKK
ncbi:MAG: hypothetical protein VB118_08185 [Oscillospiraceae bacterium]|nr:hypothetical protein [Oscillospiraceae bacterium]